jgi:hypothetical protein
MLLALQTFVMAANAMPAITLPVERVSQTSYLVVYRLKHVRDHCPAKLRATTYVC